MSAMHFLNGHVAAHMSCDWKQRQIVSASAIQIIDFQTCLRSSSRCSPRLMRRSSMSPENRSIRAIGVEDITRKRSGLRDFRREPASKIRLKERLLPDEVEQLVFLHED